MSFVNIGAELIKKYDITTPRYTSYPTALEFDDSFQESQYLSHAENSNDSLLPNDLSIYVHIPFCHSLCYFCGCNKVVTQSDNRKVNTYLSNLSHEIALRGKLFNDDRLVTQIHFGGGTPNFLSVDQLADILDQIAVQFHLDLPSNLDIGIEIDPRAINPKEIESLAKIGFNRFSIGVQDFCSEVQKEVNRVQPEADTLATIAAAKAHSKSVNVDLITGLPKQTPESFAHTLEQVIDSGVTRIAAYNFAYMPERIKAQRMIDRSAVPDSDKRFKIIKITRETLLNSGFQHIGMDHYARPDDPLAVALRNNTLQRNFQGYTTHKETDLIGIGASAISNFESAYAQNTTTLSLYNEMISANTLPIIKGISLSNDDRIRAAVIQQIMCRNSVDLSQTVNRYAEGAGHRTLSEYFAHELNNLESFIADGLITLTDIGFDISDQGRYFMRPIASTFDRNWQYQPTTKPSKNESVVDFSRRTH